MNTFRLIITSPNGNLFDDNVIKVSVRGTEGDFAIMAGHIPFITSVKKGKCHIEFKDNTNRTGYIDGGLLTVSEENVTLLSGNFHW